MAKIRGSLTEAPQNPTIHEMADAMHPLKTQPDRQMGTADDAARLKAKRGYAPKVNSSGGPGNRAGVNWNIWDAANTLAKKIGNP